MHLTTTLAILGLAAPSLISALPAPQFGHGYANGYDNPKVFPSDSWGMFPTETGTAASAKATGTANGFKYPLNNDFPNPNTAQVAEIQKQAFGTLPNGPPPPTISKEGLTNLRLIAFNELSEVAYFTELIFNITTGVPGYEINDPAVKNFVVGTLTSVQAQEELHLLNANGALQHFNANPIQPCTYKFPVANFKDAIGLAATFTDVVLGTLQDISQIFAENGDAGLVRAVASVIGNEGEQEGYFRLLQGKRPSELPFLTTSTRSFAFSALQGFVVPGSCPNANEITLDIFGPLNVLTAPIAPKDQTLTFSFNLKTTKYDVSKLKQDYSELALVYINQQNVPVVEKITNVKINGDIVTFDALFPQVTDALNGLTIAAVTVGSGPFANADAVAAKTIFGPGLIEIG